MDADGGENKPLTWLCGWPESPFYALADTETSTFVFLLHNCWRCISDWGSSSLSLTASSAGAATPCVQSTILSLVNLWMNLCAYMQMQLHTFLKTYSNIPGDLKHKSSPAACINHYYLSENRLFLLFKNWIRTTDNLSPNMSQLNITKHGLIFVSNWMNWVTIWCNCVTN